MQLEAGGPIKKAAISESTAASNEIVAAVAGKALRVIGFALTAASAVNVTLEDEDGANDMTGAMQLTASNLHLVLPEAGCGWGDTVSGKGIHLLSSGAVAVAGVIIYQEIG